MSRIHPQARALLEELDGYPLPGSPAFDLARSRRDTDESAPPRVDVHVDHVEDLRIAGVPCRLLKRQNDDLATLEDYYGPKYAEGLYAP